MLRFLREMHRSKALAEASKGLCSDFSEKKMCVWKWDMKIDEKVGFHQFSRSIFDIFFWEHGIWCASHSCFDEWKNHWKSINPRSRPSDFLDFVVELLKWPQIRRFSSFVWLNFLKEALGTWNLMRVTQLRRWVKKPLKKNQSSNQTIHLNVAIFCYCLRRDPMIHCQLLLQ